MRRSCKKLLCRTEWARALNCLDQSVSACDVARSRDDVESVVVTVVSNRNVEVR